MLDDKFSADKTERVVQSALQLCMVSDQQDNSGIVTGMNASAPKVVGIDWGTSNRRAYVFSGEGAMIRRYEDRLGILAVGGDFRNALRKLLEALEIGDADVLMS